MKQELFKVSKWCKVFENNGINALLHSLSLFVIYIPKEKGEFIVNMKKEGQTKSAKDFTNFLGKELFEILLQEKLLLSIIRDEKQDSLELGARLKKKQPLNILYLLLTDGCNFKCRYCFEDGPTLTEKFVSCKMTERIALQALKKFASLNAKYGDPKITTTINLYGGEPLLNKKVFYIAVIAIKKMVSAGELPKNTQIVLTTNGSLITEKIAKFVAENNVSVGLSIDGPQNCNDVYRKSKSNQSAYSLASRGYQLLRKNEVNAGISFTITPEVLKNESEIIRFIIKEVGSNGGLGFNILHHNAEIHPNEEYYSNAAQFIIEAFKTFRRNNIYEERIMRKVKCFTDQTPIFSDCGVTGSQIVVAPDGRIGVCQDFVKPRAYFNGKVEDADYDPIKNGLFDEWASRTPLFTEECQDCAAISFCGGGCPAGVELATGNK